VLSANPEEAYQGLVEHRRKQAAVTAETLDLGSYKRRAEISGAKTPFLNAIIDVLDVRREFWPLSDRQIHYALLNAPPLSTPASQDLATPTIPRATRR